MDYFLIYLLLKCSMIASAFDKIALISFIICLFSGVFSVMPGYTQKEYSFLRKICKRSLVSLVIFGLLTIIMPNTKEVAIIYGGGKILSSDIINKIPSFIEKKIDVLDDKQENK